MFNNIQKDWIEFIEEEKEKDYFKEILKYLNDENKKGTVIYPETENILNVFKKTSLNDIKVVIIGQDPYHNKNQAHGFSFSVENDVKIPPSLKNIYKELDNSIEDFVIPNHGNLSSWVEQGVFLLNDILTVEEHSPNSHKKIGWHIFTNKTIEYINNNCNNVVFVLWGANAIKKQELINDSKHLILTSPHPSPFSARKGFFGSNHFVLINEYLRNKQKQEINWFINN